MSFFKPNYDAPGPGIESDTPRKKGFARFIEVVIRDFPSFLGAGLLALFSSIPFILGLQLSILSHSILICLVAGLAGGILAAPQLCGLADTILRSLRDEPGFFWHRYRRAWKQNIFPGMKSGAFLGVLLSVQLFLLTHLNSLPFSWAFPALAISILVLLGFLPYLLAQIVLLDLSVVNIVRNSLFLFVACLPRTLLSAVLQAAYWLLIFLFLPFSSIVFAIAGLWLPCLLGLLSIYPILNDRFQIEERIREAHQADAPDDF